MALLSRIINYLLGHDPDTAPYAMSAETFERWREYQIEKYGDNFLDWPKEYRDIFCQIDIIRDEPKSRDE